MESFSITNLIILSTTLIVIIFYTIETYKLRKINAAQLKLNLELYEPDIISYFDTGKIHGQLLFIIENSGGSSAYNINAKFDREFDTASVVINKNFTVNPLFSNRLLMLPAKKYIILDAGLIHNIYSKYKDNTDAYKYNLKIEYENYQKVKYTKTYFLSIEQFVSKVTLSDKTRTEEYLEGINSSLRKIANN